MQRKVFRVESMFATKRAATPAVDAGNQQSQMVAELSALRAQLSMQAGERHGADGVQGLKAELARLQDTVVRNKDELGRLIDDGKERRMARAASELGAAVDGIEMATQKILKTVEIIDENAKALTATLQDGYKRGLAHDIQDQVVHIFEACNFQDLSGQRIGNVIAMLTAIEQQVAVMIERCNGVSATVSPPAANTISTQGLLNGPKLDGDPGHASQRDIDEMFG